jgi:hypothetical protein
MWCRRCRKGTPVLIQNLSATVIYCQHCGDAPLLTHPAIVQMRRQAAERRYRPMLEQTLRTEFPELLNQNLTDQMVQHYCRKLRQRNLRRQRSRNYRLEQPIEAYEDVLAR